MNSNVTRFFELSSQSRTARDQASARRDHVSRMNGISLGDAQDDPEYKSLDQLASRLYWEADALTPHLIRDNLARLGIQDMIVIGVLYFSNNERFPNGVRFRDGREAGRVEMLLSDLCGLRHGGLAKRFGVDPGKVSLRIAIELNGKCIGHVDSDGDFDYEAAPNLRTALGWKVATDGGRVRLIEGFDLDEASRRLSEVILRFGICKTVFLGPWMKALEKVFVYEKTSRFGDGYCGAANTLWRVATRELGQEHEGYEFYY